MKITEIGQIAITVSDVPVALEFYRDILDLEFLFSPADNLAFLKCGTNRIMLTTPQGAGDVGKNSILYFKTTEIEKFFASAVAKGKTEAPLLDNINIGKYSLSTKWAPKTLRRWGGKVKTITQGLHKDSKVSDKGKKQLQALYDDFGRQILSDDKYKKIFEDGHFHFECMYFSR